MQLLLHVQAVVNEGCIVQIEAHRDDVHYLITNVPAVRHPVFKHNGYAGITADQGDEAQQDTCR